ncbi:MAG: toll/interleukin-1 receptor domain-containing protein [Pseudomonadota bacterium]
MRAFLSYRRADAEAEARSIEQRLLQMPDIRHVFLDHEAIPKGEDFVRSIQKAIRKSGVVLALIGPDWRGVDAETGTARLMDDKDFVRLELAEALAADKRVIPVMLNETVPPRPEELPPELRSLATINVTRVRMEDFEEDIDDLLDVMFGNRRRISRWMVPRMTLWRAVRLFFYGLAAAAAFVLLVAILNQELTGGGTLHTLLVSALGSDQDPDIGFLYLLLHLVADVFVVGALIPFFYRLLRQRSKRK